MKDEALTANRPMTVEEYIAYEERADVRDLDVYSGVSDPLIPEV